VTNVEGLGEQVNGQLSALPHDMALPGQALGSFWASLEIGPVFERPTSNIESPASKSFSFDVRCWMLDVRPFPFVKLTDYA
jgi:hypothetical protein